MQGTRLSKTSGRVGEKLFSQPEKGNRAAWGMLKSSRKQFIFKGKPGDKGDPCRAERGRQNRQPQSMPVRFSPPSKVHSPRKARPPLY